MHLSQEINCIKYILLLVPWIALAQQDPAWEAYRVWDGTHPYVAGKSADRGKALLEASGEWTSKWPDSKLAWEQRQRALIDIHSNSAEDWRKTGENLLRLNPPHTWIHVVAENWMSHGVNLEAAEKLLSDEIAYLDSRPPDVRPAQPTLADLVVEADSATRISIYIGLLIQAQLIRHEAAAARKTVEQYRESLEKGFRRYYDQDPLEAFPEYWARYYILASHVAELEQRCGDAALLMLPVITNPFSIS